MMLKAAATIKKTVASNNDSRDDDQRSVGSKKRDDEGGEDNFVVAMASPAKKTKTHRLVVPRKVWNFAEANEDDYGFYNDVETLLTEGTKLLGNGDPLAVN